MSKRNIIWLSLVGLIIVTSLVLTPWYISEILRYDQAESAADYGQQFGAVSAFFSGLAFLGVAIAILFQRSELETAKDQFKQQTFENTFFQLLRLHNDIVESMSVFSSGQTWIEGRRCFREFFNILSGHILHQPVGRAPEEAIKQGYAQFHNQYQDQVGHYFRNLYHIMKFIEDGKAVNPRFYAALVKAQLSSHELLLLFYDCLSDLGRKKFKPLVEQFGLLEHLPRTSLIDPNHENLYSSEAYRG